MLKISLIKSGGMSWRRQMLLQMWHPNIWKLWRQQWTPRWLSCLINAKLYWWQQRENEGLRAINKQLMAKCESQRVSFVASKEAITSSRMLEAKVEQAKSQIKFQSLLQGFIFIYLFGRGRSQLWQVGTSLQHELSGPVACGMFILGPGIDPAFPALTGRF